MAGMSHARRSLAAVAARRHGVFTRADALAAGYSPATISRRQRDGEWLALYPGVFVFAGTPVTWHLTVRAAILATTPHVVVRASADGRSRLPPVLASHTTAARLWELPDAPYRRDVEVLITRRSDRRPRGVIVHRAGKADADLVTHVDGIPATSPLCTLRDVAGLVDRRWILAAIADCARRKLVTLEHARDFVDRQAGRRGIAALRWSLEVLSPDVGKIRHWVEAVAIPALVRAGLPRPRLAFKVREVGGRQIAEADLAYPDARLIIEIDGYAWHSLPRQKMRDESRQNRLVLEGWTVLRYSYWVVRERPEQIVADVARALSRR